MHIEHTEPQAREAYRLALMAYRESWQDGNAPATVRELRDQLELAHRVWSRVVRELVPVE